jgi:hypothetical protein
MPVTALSDITQFPVNISDYILQQSIETNAFFQSGIITRNVPATVQALLNNGGDTVTYPFWNDLTGTGQILDEADDITVGKVTSDKGVAPVFERGEAWGSNDLVADFLGEDPMLLISNRVSEYWNRHYSKNLLNICSGAVGAVSANVLNISGLTGGAAVIDGSSFIDAEHCLGDRRQKLRAVAMHSKVVAALRKQGLIEYRTDSEGVAQKYAYYGDLRVIEDDTMVDAAGVYTTYLFAEGSVMFGNGTVKVPEEVERQALKSGGLEYLVSRKRWMSAISGVSWKGVPAKKTASNTELASSANWERKYDQKNIGVVKFIHRIAPAA